MPHYHYLIVGGSMCADAAVGGIRSQDEEGSIGIIGAEPDPPYSRPPLSKGFWRSPNPPLGKIWRRNSPQHATLHLGSPATTLDPENKRVSDEGGKEYTFDKLLLTTGATPRRLPFEEDSIIYFRGLHDYHRLRELANTYERFAVIGGGFIGSEIAAALARNGKQVTMLFPEEGIGALSFPLELAHFLNDYYHEQGVQVLAGEGVTGLSQRGAHYVLETTGGKELEVDGVVAGIGVEPNVALAQAGSLTVDDGIVVDTSLQTNVSGIYAAGDVANFYNPALGKRLRVEHEDNAITMGRMAGQAMTGEKVEYDHLPFFYSDLFDLGYQAVGELDPSLETVVDWTEPNRTGVIYYLQEGRVRGVLLWGIRRQLDAARALVTSPGPFTAKDLQGRIPEEQ